MTDSGNSKRSEAFRRNDSLENLLSTLNQALGPAEKELLGNRKIEGDTHPVVFVLGPLRSGTTLFMQWLASTGIIAYPTNLLSRFYGAPTVGAMVQLLLTDHRYNFRDEILDFQAPIEFTSENGKTVGALAPNEFWYFWRRFLPFEERDCFSDEELLRLADTDTLVSELASLTRVFGKPFALKAMILNYNIPFLDQIFENAVFVQTTRDPVANVASIIDARKMQYGDEHKWYSFKIPEYSKLVNLDPLSQAAGQVLSINGALIKGMSSLHESKKMIVGYEQFCRDPQAVYTELLEKLGLSLRDHPYAGAQRFKESRDVECDMASEIEEALAKVKL